MSFETTKRGFYIYARITDTHGSEIRVQQSSAYGMDKLHIFVRDHLGNDVLHFMPHRTPDPWMPPKTTVEGETYQSISAHLDVEQCRELIKALRAHIDTVEREGLGEENVDENGWIKSK